MIFRKIFHRNEDGEHNFWMSYTDLMSGFLVVFIIISAVMYKNYQDKTRESNASLKNLIVEYKNIFYLDDPNISVEFNSDRGSIILTHHNPPKIFVCFWKRHNGGGVREIFVQHSQTTCC